MFHIARSYGARQHERFRRGCCQKLLKSVMIIETRSLGFGASSFERNFDFVSPGGTMSAIGCGDEELAWTVMVKSLNDPKT